MKCAIIYASVHHGNTKKVLDTISNIYDIQLLDATAGLNYDLSSFDLIGFASGIYFSKFHNAVMQAVKNQLPTGKKVFFLYTCGAPAPTYLNDIRRAVKEKACAVIGEYHCLGYDTFGPFKLIGGIAKGHPNQEELADAADFLNKMIHDAKDNEKQRQKMK